MEVERPKPAPYLDPEPGPSIDRRKLALVIAVFAVIAFGNVPAVQFVVAWVGAFVLLAVLIGWPLAYIAEQVIRPNGE